LVRVRNRRWVVADVDRSGQAPDVLARPEETAQNLVTLTSVEDDGLGETLGVIWEVEPGAVVLEGMTLPEPHPDHFDPPDRLDAFLDAVRWGAITSAERDLLRAPFRSGIDVEDYQLDPVARALTMPRTNLLIADDVGLGKTIEAGLVVQELLLRHRARTVLVVCPASLCLQWRDEMGAKFGLEFRVVDTAYVKDLRRTQGLYANPWTSFPRLITSIDWLKRPRLVQLLRDALPPDGIPSYPRTFDMLIVDEAHNCAPAAGGRYAMPSKRTEALRTLAPHCEHRLFLTATPHNGYRESFTALLEMLDDQRFARGVDPDPAALRRVMVRRLKSELPPRWDGTPRFPVRWVEALEVTYSDTERGVHSDLVRYGQLRRKAAERDGTSAVAADFVLLLLKKRLFSSPAAFAATLAVHRVTVERGRSAGTTTVPSPSVLRAAIEVVDEEFADDAAQELATEDALVTVGRTSPVLSAEERTLLDRMSAWADVVRHRRDTKLATLIGWLDHVVRPDGRWCDERVIIFTEYRDTQRWLAEQLTAAGLGGDRLSLLYGGMDPELREHIKQEFLHSPAQTAVRILVATDAASEGIDLQKQCHRLVHFEVPWNPNRMEQRNGRVDRHGQPAPEVLIYHFVGAGWETAAAGSLEDDLQFLFTAARKVETIRDDLGSVGPVIADQLVEAMLGQRRRLDTVAAEQRSPTRTVLRVERELRERLDRLAERLHESRTVLGVSPERLQRAVRVGLDLARQPGLAPGVLDRPHATGAVWTMPALTGGWARASIGVADPLTARPRPITFDETVAEGHDDVVYVHLGHRLVQQCLLSMRAEIWATGGPGGGTGRGGRRARLARVTARLVPDLASEGPAVVAHGRLVVTGADGHRLHEEMVSAGGSISEGRFRRLNVGEVEQLLAASTDDMAGAIMRERLAGLWPQLAGPLGAALEQRAQDRATSLTTRSA